MFLNIKMLILFLSQFTVVGLLHQEAVNFYEIKSKEGCLILTKDKINLDTLCLNSFKGDGISHHKLIDRETNTVTRVQLKIGAIDNFSDFSYLVDKWKVQNDKFELESSLKIPLGDCYARKLGIKLTEKGIKWKYKRGLFKKNLKGLIPYSKLEESIGQTIILSSISLLWELGNG
ncbi:MAG: hypothetical protein AAFP19_13465 [Bacteroidota bacterium]